MDMFVDDNDDEEGGAVKSRSDTELTAAAAETATMLDVGERVGLGVGASPTSLSHSFQYMAASRRKDSRKEDGSDAVA